MGRAMTDPNLLNAILRHDMPSFIARSFMTLDQVNKLNGLFNLKEDEVSTREQALQILGM